MSYTITELKELCDCYKIDYSPRERKQDLIKKILDFEFWNFEKYDDEDEDCENRWSAFDNLDYEVYGYNGENYHKGRDSTKDLYCNFYEKHGFRENPDINLTLKCFSATPLPS